MSNLSKKQIALLRRTERFMLKEPRRFDMTEGLVAADHFKLRNLLEEPPCGTACCIAGSMYAVSKKLELNRTQVGWSDIVEHLTSFGFSDSFAARLFFIKSLHPSACSRFGAQWPDYFEQAYERAKTAYERALIGVARIEHFIATDGLE